MTDAASWPPLCGAVAGCGALLAVSGAVKLVRTVRGTGGGTAVQKALRLNDAGWRIFQAAAGIAELAVGLCVGTATLPAVADALMACQGTIFVSLLVYVMRERVPGDCGCVTRRRPSAPEKRAVTRWTVARAAFIALAGLIGAALRVHPPYALPRSGAAFAWGAGLAVLALLVVVDLEWSTPRCRRPLLFPTRTVLGDVTGHAAYQAVAASIGARGEHALFRRSGCFDEFWFPAHESGHEDRPYLEVKAARTASGSLALRASVVEHAPAGRMRSVRVPRTSPAPSASASTAAPAPRDGRSRVRAGVLGG